jgi:uncharacterized protein (DUF2062 family)
MRVSTTVYLIALTLVVSIMVLLLFVPITTEVIWYSSTIAGIAFLFHTAAIILDRKGK